MAARRNPDRFGLSPAYKQGGLDGLCGLYAAINAIHLLTAPVRPLSAACTAALFECGAAWLNERGLLLAAVTDGVDEDAQYAMTRLLAEETEQMISASLSITRPVEPDESFQRRKLLSVIDAGLAQRAVLIVSLGGTYSHYTVLSGRSETRYYAYDSDGIKWINRQNLGVLAARSRKRHQIGKSGLVRMSLTES
ncbi:hypothetical protein [Roseinatronobacter monicus]|uniref:Peptidase C58 YopT-type domain-containing protein n=1 Tax=Roseinatronobacter monicus TaxID=393481 RepID=A0A543KBI0_9RHOB|nr:hypothetical protein [Roseinatronobacter monicus]TQM92424.1 hypothetical protein BD293_1030 [Roseinatronobacter monicus]